MLAALAPPAARVPPARVARTRLQRGSPRDATTIVGRVVTSSSSMIRGLVSATKPARRRPTEISPGQAGVAEVAATDIGP